MANNKYLLFCLLTISALFVSCDRTEPQPETSKGISYVRAYSSDQKILIEWHTWSGFIDFDLEAPPVMNTRLLMSTSNRSSGFEEIHIGQIEGNDSVEVTGLMNDVPHYFKLETYGFDGQKIGTSQPITTIPGNLSEEILSFQISDSSDFFTNTSLSWSPNGTDIAFIGIDDSGYKNIHILDRNTLSVRVVSEHEAEALSDISWSPDGKYLAYLQSPTITAGFLNYRIWLLDLSTLKTWPISSGPVDFDPDWISDTQLIFAKGTKGPPNIPELMLLDPSNGSETALTDDGTLYKYSPNVHRVTGKILFHARKSGDISYDIYTTTIGAGKNEQLVNDFWSSTNPIWTPNGESVLFTSNRTGQNEIWSMRLIDGTLEQKTRGGHRGSSRYSPAISSSGNLLAYIQLESDNSVFLKVIELE